MTSFQLDQRLSAYHRQWFDQGYNGGVRAAAFAAYRFMPPRLFKTLSLPNVPGYFQRTPNDALTIDSLLISWLAAGCWLV